MDDFKPLTAEPVAADAVDQSSEKDAEETEGVFWTPKDFGAVALAGCVVA